MTKETRVKRWFSLLALTSAAALGLSAPEIRSVGSFQVVVFDLTKGDYAPRVVLEERLVSVRVQRKDDLPDASDVWDMVRAEEQVLGDDGRIVLRASWMKRDSCRMRP